LTKKLKIGDQCNEELAFQPRQSACMIMFFTPLHFDIQHPCYAFEYQAMLELERQRLGAAKARKQRRTQANAFRREHL
jgi:hypothetical protein